MIRTQYLHQRLGGALGGPGGGGLSPLWEAGGGRRALTSKHSKNVVRLDLPAHRATAIHHVKVPIPKSYIIKAG